MIGKDENSFFRETPSGRIIIAKYNREKAKKRKPTEKELIQRARFKAAHEKAIAALMSSELRPGLEAAFKAQDKYPTLLGFVMAKMMEEPGD